MLPLSLLLSLLLGIAHCAVAFGLLLLAFGIDIV